MEFTTILITAISTLLGGGIGAIFTLRASRKKAFAEAAGANAQAESTELDNVEKAITIWREMAVELKNELQESRTKYLEVGKQVEDLRKEVCNLTATSNKILKMLDRITHDNLEKVIEQIKDEINGKVS